MKRIILIIVGVLAACGITYAFVKPKSTNKTDKENTANTNTNLTAKKVGKDTEVSYIDSSGKLVKIKNPTQEQVQTAITNNIDNSLNVFDPTFGFQFGLFG